MIPRTTCRIATAALSKGVPSSVSSPSLQMLHNRNYDNQPFVHSAVARSVSSEFLCAGPKSRDGTVTLCFRFGFRHRHPTSHDCPRNLAVEAETAKNNKNELARSLLAKHFPTATSKGASPSPSYQTKPGNTSSSDPKKLALAQKIQAMKMHQRAIPGDPKDKTANVPLDQKLHVQIKLEGNDPVSVLWFRKVNVSLRVTCQCCC